MNSQLSQIVDVVLISAASGYGVKLLEQQLRSVFSSCKLPRPRPVATQPSPPPPARPPPPPRPRPRPRSPPRDSPPAPRSSPHLPPHLPHPLSLHHHHDSLILLIRVFVSHYYISRCSLPLLILSPPHSDMCWAEPGALRGSRTSTSLEQPTWASRRWSIDCWQEISRRWGRPK